MNRPTLNHNATDKLVPCTECGKQNISKNRLDYAGGSVCQSGTGHLSPCYAKLMNKAGEPKRELTPCGYKAVNKISSFSRTIAVINKIRLGSKATHGKIAEIVMKNRPGFNREAITVAVNIICKAGYLKRLNKQFCVIKHIPRGTTSPELYRMAGYRYNGKKKPATPHGSIVA